MGILKIYNKIDVYTVHELCITIHLLIGFTFYTTLSHYQSNWKCNADRQHSHPNTVKCMPIFLSSSLPLFLSFFFVRHTLFWIHPLKYAYVSMPYTRYSSLAVLYSCAFCIRCLNISVNLCVNILQ